MTEIKKNQVYTSKEVENLLKISSSTLKRLLKNDLIKAAKLGGQYRFLGKELLRVVSPDVDKEQDAGVRSSKKNPDIGNVIKK